MNKIQQRKKATLDASKDYYINFDHKYFTNLTRTQVAFLHLVSKLNKAFITATNKEIAAYLGTTDDGSGVSKMIRNINKKYPKLLKVSFDTPVNHLGKIMTIDKDCYSKARNIVLTRELHIKGNDYVNIPAFVAEKRSCFLSSNELKVLAYIKAMPEKHFKGLLRVIAKKLGLSLEIVKRALAKLVSINAIKKHYSSIKHKLKNIWYRINYISLNHQWTYDSVKEYEAMEIKQKVPENSEQENS